MNKTITTGLLSIMAIGLAFFACDTSDTEALYGPAKTGRMQLVFDNVAGSSDLNLNAGTYKNAVGESFVVTKLNYFVSNIRLRKADGSEHVVPQDNSYFLIQEDKPASQTITLTNVPVADYTGLSFLVGVDSLRSLADISKRTGVLDPGLSTHDAMYWEWNSGYIFMKLEGTSPSAPAAQNNRFFCHVGGFGGGYNGKKTINNLRTITLPFNSDMAKVLITNTPSVRLTADILTIFNGPTKLSIGQHSSVMFEPYSANIADNYAQMFRYDRMETNQ